MKSKFFKDTQGLESTFESCTPDKVSVCLRLSRTAYELAANTSSASSASALPAGRRQTSGPVQHRRRT